MKEFVSNKTHYAAVLESEKGKLETAQSLFLIKLGRDVAVVFVCCNIVYE